MAAYLQSADYAAFGVPDATVAQVAAASRVFDTFIGKPEGLLWTPDFNGAPAFMTNLTPTLSYANVTVAAGTGVILTLPYGTFGLQSVGDVVIFDKAGTCEACVITAAAGSTITLAYVNANHNAVTMDFGLTISEEVRGRMRLSRSPVANILCGFGRYSYDRELRNLSSGFDDFEALLITDYGTSGVSNWNQLDTTLWDVNNVTGVIRMPFHRHEVIRLRYVAGWSQANLPDLVKQCVANIIRNLIDGEIPANIKSVKAGDSTIVNFNSSLIDDDTRQMAQAFKAVRI